MVQLRASAVAVLAFTAFKARKIGAPKKSLLIKDQRSEISTESSASFSLTTLFFACISSFYSSVASLGIF